MAPKKKQEVQKLSLGDFLNDTSFGGGGSWADEVEDTIGTQPLPPPERRVPTSSYGGGNDRGYHSIRDNLPQQLPDKPPYTAHLGNLSFDATVETVTDFFAVCKVVNVRIIEDRDQNRPKGFAYAEFADLEGLKTALTRDGQIFQGRTIRVRVADPPRGGGGFGGPDPRELDWSTRRGPLPDPPSRGGDRRGPDFGERRRDFQSTDDGKVRDLSNWERRGPLSPLAQPDRPESREGSRSRALESRSESFRGNRRASPAAWGPSEGQEGSRPPRREFSDRPERPERVPTAAERDFNWRNSMRPDPPVKSPGQSREGSETPSSPAPSGAVPAGRPKLNLAKRTVSEATDTAAAPPPSDSKPNPFGGARPIDTAAREREVEERRMREKKEAEERAKAERLAKEAAAAEAAEKAAAEAAAKANGEKEEAAEEKKATAQEGAANGATAEQRLPLRTREPREAPKSRAAESGNWRAASNEQRALSRGGHGPGGPRRGGPGRGPRDAGRPPRTNGSGPTQQLQSPNTEQAPPTPTVDEDGWTTVAAPNKGRRGQASRPVA
ncbi:uncharacterized protein P884DRAFT_5841 [Thermothelomyces heterothallicus CBS 202.75]|uniref:uncharacterized protein n=1 Tax=Thermothelomyces heterothallicus CBS 202.75 TaxID=1149848 RepID=UPI003743269F